jgi:hypothetical protein
MTYARFRGNEGGNCKHDRTLTWNLSRCRGDHAADTHKRVKRREMRGYFGQWPRIKFGMMPAEGGLIDGKSIAVEPALLTTI